MNQHVWLLGNTCGLRDDIRTLRSVPLIMARSLKRALLNESRSIGTGMRSILTYSFQRVSVQAAVGSSVASTTSMMTSNGSIQTFP